MNTVSNHPTALRLDRQTVRNPPETSVRTLKAHLQTALKRVGLYHRLKASCLYDLYWRVADPSLIEDRSREVGFYRSLLNGFREGDLVFDIGANHGAKTDVFLRLGARVVAVEPDHFNQGILEEKFHKYRVSRRPVTVVGKAISDTAAVETMWINEQGSAKNTFSEKWVTTLKLDEKRFGRTLDFPQQKEVETMTLEQLMAAYGLPFFVKIDVEGYELNVLLGMRRPVPYLSFEVNLPEFRSEGLQCVELLGRVATHAEFNYTVDCRQGMVLAEWLKAREFSTVLSRCSDESIEVFWKTPLAIRR